MQTALPLIANTLAEIQVQVSKERIVEGKCKVLFPVPKECEARLADLGALFEKDLREKGESKLRKALGSLRQDRKVEGIAQSLCLFVQTLTYYHVVASAPTLDDITALLESMPTLNTAPLPAALKKTCCLVPVQPADDFISRKEILSEVESKFCFQEKYYRVALVGLGGIV